MKQVTFIDKVLGILIDVYNEYTRLLVPLITGNHNAD